MHRSGKQNWITQSRRSEFSDHPHARDTQGKIQRSITDFYPQRPSKALHGMWTVEYATQLKRSQLHLSLDAGIYEANVITYAVTTKRNPVVLGHWIVVTFCRISL